MTSRLGAVDWPFWLIAALFAAITVGAASWVWYTKSDYDGERQYDRHTKPPHSYEVCVEIPPWVDTCSTQQDNAANDKKREDDDLAAQQEMAYWAFLMALVAVPSLIISIGGVFLIYATLAKTAESIVVSDKNSRDETRAYVHVEDAELKWGSRLGHRPCIQLTVLNAGQTPAKWFMVRSKIIVRELTEDGFDRGGFVPPDMSDREWKPWSALGGGERLSFESFHPDDFERLKDCFQSRDKFSVNVTGVVRYETVLSEVFETEFWFTRRPMPGFSETVVSSVDNGGITIRETKENPRKMQRAAGVMRTYAFVERAKS